MSKILDDMSSFPLAEDMTALVIDRCLRDDSLENRVFINLLPNLLQLHCLVIDNM